MTRVRPRRERGPGFAPFPRHGVLRVSDLVPPPVDLATVRAVLAAHGVPEGDRDEPVGRTVRAVVTATGAGTVVTLECRGDLLRPRSVVLRRLGRSWESIAADLEGAAPGCRNPGQNRTEGHSGGS